MIAYLQYQPTGAGYLHYETLSGFRTRQACGFLCLPFFQVINSDRKTPITPEDIENLKETIKMTSSKIDGRTAGIDTIGRVLSENTETIQADDLVNVGWLLRVGASTIDGLRYTESQANSIMTCRRVETGEESS